MGPRLRLHLLSMLGALASPACASPSGVEVNGHAVAVATEPGRFQVTVDRKTVIDDKDDAGVVIQGAYEGGGRAYVLISEASGGNACAAQFQAIDVSGATPLVSPVFGTCSDLPDVSVDGGALHVSMKRTDGLAADVFVYADGKLSTVARPVDLTPVGPEKAPGDDLASLVAGKYAFDLVKLAAVADPLRRAMGPAAFDEARRMALGGPSSPGEAHGDLAVVEACEAHNCGAHHTKWVFDRHGHAAATITRAGKTRVYGQPTKEMRALLS
jgi:hypothetical protein